MKNYNLSKITHVDELTSKHFIEFCENFHLSELSEKVDGQFFSFGVDEYFKFFSKSRKSNLVYNSEFYNNITMMKPFAVLHEYLKANHYKIPTIQMFGEYLNKDSFNTIEYNIDKNLFIIFDLRFKGESIYYNNKMFTYDMDKLQFKNKHIYTNIEQEDLTKLDLYKEYIKLFNLYSTLPRGQKKKDTKIELQEIQNNIYIYLCDAYLKNIKSFIDNKTDIEGFVVKLPNDKMIKLVDKRKFTEKNNENHKVSNDLRTELKQLRFEIIKNVFGNRDILLDNKKVKEKLILGNPKSYNDCTKIILSDLKDEKGLLYNQKKSITFVTEKYNKIVTKYKKIEIKSNSIKNVVQSRLEYKFNSYEDIIHFLIPKLSTIFYEINR